MINNVYFKDGVQQYIPYNIRKNEVVLSNRFGWTKDALTIEKVDKDKSIYNVYINNPFLLDVVKHKVNDINNIYVYNKRTLDYQPIKNTITREINDYYKESIAKLFLDGSFKEEIYSLFNRNLI